MRRRLIVLGIMVGLLMLPAVEGSAQSSWEITKWKITNNHVCGAQEKVKIKFLFATVDGTAVRDQEGVIDIAWNNGAKHKTKVYDPEIGFYRSEGFSDKVWMGSLTGPTGKYLSSAFSSITLWTYELLTLPEIKLTHKKICVGF